MVFLKISVGVQIGHHSLHTGKYRLAFDNSALLQNKKYNSSEIIARNITMCKARCNRNLLIFPRTTSNGHNLSTKQNLFIEKLLEICQLFKLEFAHKLAELTLYWLNLPVHLDPKLVM